MAFGELGMAEGALQGGCVSSGYLMEAVNTSQRLPQLVRLFSGFRRRRQVREKYCPYFEA